MSRRFCFANVSKIPEVFVYVHACVGCKGEKTWWRGLNTLQPRRRNGKHLCPSIANPQLTRRVFREETFGPLVPLFRFKSDDEAVALANDTEYGARHKGWLLGGVWGGMWGAGC